MMKPIRKDNLLSIVFTSASPQDRGPASVHIVMKPECWRHSQSRAHCLLQNVLILNMWWVLITPNSTQNFLIITVQPCVIKKTER